jgi:hypothetical protein
MLLAKPCEGSRYGLLLLTKASAVTVHAQDTVQGTTTCVPNVTIGTRGQGYPQIPSLSSYILACLGQGVRSRVGPTSQLTTSSTKRGDKGRPHTIGPVVRAHHVAGVLTPEAHQEPGPSGF